jgi:hypothetical protein
MSCVIAAATWRACEALNPSTHEQNAGAFGPMVAAGRVVDDGCTAKLSDRQHQSCSKKAPVFKVCDEGGKGLIDSRAAGE